MLRITEQEKKKRISDFIRTETDIKIVEATQYLLKALFIGCIDECYIKEMHQGFSEYNDCTLLELLYHVNNKYAKMDDHIVEANIETFDEAPDMDRPIDGYFAKQE